MQKNVGSVFKVLYIAIEDKKLNLCMTSILVEELKINIELNQVYFCSRFKIYCEPKKIFVI